MVSNKRFSVYKAHSRIGGFATPFNSILIDVGDGDDFDSQIFDEKFFVGIDVSKADIGEAFGVDHCLDPFESG